jgi:hypothetical protein
MIRPTGIAESPKFHFETWQNMFASCRRLVAVFWLLMAILGHVGPSPVVARQASGEARTASICCLQDDASSLPRARSSAPAAVDSHRVTARYVAAIEDDTPVDTLPPAFASEIKSIDAERQGIVAGAPIERWRFDRVQARYQALLKKGSAEPAVAEAIRLRLARLGQLEEAAKAAATIETILARSHRRDREVVEVRRRLKTATARRSRAYEAMGYMQTSAQNVDGQKLFVLIGKNGKTVAFLRIPPGLDPDPMLARKVGVRGDAHYDEELQSRLITVRTLEPIETRR